MAEGPVPRYMAQLLEQLGWNQGTRIPLANSDNQVAESLLLSRYLLTFKTTGIRRIVSLGYLLSFTFHWHIGHHPSSYETSLRALPAIQRLKYINLASKSATY